MLKIEKLHVSYGGIQALRGVSLEVPDGKIVTLSGTARSCWESPSTESSALALP